MRRVMPNASPFNIKCRPIWLARTFGELDVLGCRRGCGRPVRVAPSILGRDGSRSLMSGHRHRADRVRGLFNLVFRSDGDIRTILIGVESLSGQNDDRHGAYAPSRSSRHRYHIVRSQRRPIPLILRRQCRGHVRSILDRGEFGAAELRNLRHFDSRSLPLESGRSADLDVAAQAEATLKSGNRSHVVRCMRFSSTLAGRTLTDSLVYLSKHIMVRCFHIPYCLRGRPRCRAGLRTQSV